MMSRTLEWIENIHIDAISQSFLVVYILTSIVCFECAILCFPVYPNFQIYHHVLAWKLLRRQVPLITAYKKVGLMPVLSFGYKVTFKAHGKRVKLCTSMYLHKPG